MFLQTEDVIKILLAVLLGGLIGGEREARDKSAGFRTIILICIGAALFTMLSSYLAKDSDPTRIAANIVTGIGFLGAGAILREGNRITGLTTASTIWLAAAIGMACGAGQYVLAIVVTFFALLVLWVFPSIENKIDNLRHISTYQVICQADLNKCEQLEASFRQHGLKVYDIKRIKMGGNINIVVQASGAPKAHNRLVNSLLQNADVHELTY